MDGPSVGDGDDTAPDEAVEDTSRAEGEGAEDAEAAGSDPVEDLDAVLDDDDEDDLDRLIALTVAGAEAEDDAEEVVAEDLDDLEEVLGAEEPEPTTVELEDETPVALPEGAPSSLASPARGPWPTGEPTRTGPEAEIDLEDVVDLGPESTPELRDRLLAQALAHAETQDARYRVPFSDSRRSGRWKASIATILFLVAGAVAVAPPTWARPESPARIGPASREHSTRLALLLQAQQVDAYRIRFQRIPASLDELPIHLPGVRLVRSNRAYQLVAYAGDGQRIVYDSSDPDPSFAGLEPVWLP